MPPQGITVNFAAVPDLVYRVLTVPDPELPGPLPAAATLEADIAQLTAEGWVIAVVIPGSDRTGRPALLVMGRQTGVRYIPIEQPAIVAAGMGPG